MFDIKGVMRIFRLLCYNIKTNKIDSFYEIAYNDCIKAISALIYKVNENIIFGRNL